MSRLDAALHGLARWDERICARFNRGLRHRLLHRAMRLVSRLGDGVFWYALMLAWLALDGRDGAPPVAHMLVVGIVCTVLYALLKRGTSRPRPYEVHAHIAPGHDPLDRFSFPSGHTLHAVAFTLVATAHAPVLVFLLVPFTLAVAASRLVLGLHYPSDVLAGALLGGAVALASLGLAPL